MARFSAFFSLSRLDRGSVALLLLEHPERIPERVLRGAFPWTQQELGRMDEFSHDGAKTSWCVSRMLARSVLSVLTGVNPRSLEFSYGEWGKPDVRDSGLSFNWAHAPGCVAFAVSRAGDIGCDIEDSRREGGSFRDIADTYYLDEERAWMDRASAPWTPWDRFLTLFVEKEARLKASGIGLNAPLSSVPCSLLDPPFRKGGVHCRRTGTDDRYIAAVCASGVSEDNPEIVPVFDVRTYRMSVEDMS